MNTTQVKTCWLTVNRLCQLRCSWCYAQGIGYGSSQNMDYNIAVRLIDIMKEMGVQYCKIIGGEPSLYPYIKNVLKYLRKKGIKSVLITNGVLYANKEIMCEHFDAGLDSLIISIKAGTSNDYKRYTGANVFDKVKQAINNLTDYRGGTTITITKEIIPNIIQTILTITESSGNFINLHFCSPTLILGVPKNHSMASPKIAAKAMEKAVKCLKIKKTSYNVQISIPFCLFNSNFINDVYKDNCLTSGCIVNKKSGIIFNTNGEAGFCNHMMEFPFGKLYADFSNATELQRLYFDQDKFFNVTNRAPSVKCTTCQVNHICCGGCPLLWTQFKPSIYVKGGNALKNPVIKMEEAYT